MNEFMDFYFDWGILISGLFVFAGGHTVGWFRHKERCEKLMRAERVRLATNNTVKTPVYLEDEWSEG